ncbi:MAG: 4-oxalomesaconate tautomerase, partial [Alphaproteobacteria bacterium]
LAVTGSQCLAACLICPGTVAEGIVTAPDRGPHRMRLEHPMGILEVVVDYRRQGDDFTLISAGLTRTARKIAAGEVFVPRRVWDGSGKAG